MSWRQALAAVKGSGRERMCRQVTRTIQGVSMLNGHQRHLAVLLCLMVQASSSNAREAQEASGCRWTGPPVEWVLARHPAAGEISGGLHSDVVPYLQRSGIPLSFVTETTGDERVGLRVGPGTTVEDVLEEIVRQVPQ